jgi:nucleoside 2-deoxyribosyltransferase
MKAFVYLAGPILGQTEGQANNWRERVADKLKDHGIVGISPLRCEPIHGPVYGTGYPDEKFGSPRAILSKNMFDVKRCDMTLAYLPKPVVDISRWPYDQPHHSWGTMQELAWARAFDRPAILVTNDTSIRDHPVLNASAGWVLETLDEATEVLIGILGGYTGGKNV